MGPENNDTSQTREVFQQLKGLRDKQAPEGLLSMGMSSDWEIAVEEGGRLDSYRTLAFYVTYQFSKSEKTLTKHRFASALEMIPSVLRSDR